MKQLLILIILFPLLLSNCSKGNNSSVTEIDSTKIFQQAVKQNNISETINKPQTTFEEYLLTLDKIPLPLIHNSIGKLPELSKNYDKNGFEKYKHIWTSRPLGILYNDSNVVTLINCSIGDVGLVPFLTTYDRSGNKIDSLGPYKKSGEGELYYGIEYVTIKEDRTIQVIDTVKEWSLNKTGNDIDNSSLQVTTDITKYVIGQDGRIKEIKK